MANKTYPPATKEATVHDMKTHFSQYAAELLDGTYGEIIVKNRKTPILRIVPFDPPKKEGLRFGTAKELGHPSVDVDAFMGLDAETADMFKDYL